VVDREDALALAAALEKALSDPQAAGTIAGLIDEWWADMQASTSDDELARLTEQQKRLLRASMRKPEFSAEFTRELIELCRQGEFRIE
jgi:hypothetical protein